MNITNSAKGFIEEVLKENNASNIRVIFGGMGWGGPKLGLVLEEPQEKDVVEEINGIKVAFEETIFQQTKELTLELQETPEGKGLVLLGQEECC